MWLDRRGVRRLGTQLDSFPGCRQREDAGDCGRHPDRRCRLSFTPIPHHCDGRRGAGDPDCGVSGPHEFGRLCAGRGALGRLRLYRHECVGARQCAYRTGRHQGHWAGAGRGISRRRHHRHAGGRPGTAGGDGLLHVSGAGRRGHSRQAQSADRICLWILADFHLRPSGRRHFHKGR